MEGKPKELESLPATEKKKLRVEPGTPPARIKLTEEVFKGRGMVREAQPAPLAEQAVTPAALSAEAAAAVLIAVLGMVMAEPGKKRPTKLSATLETA